MNLAQAAMLRKGKEKAMQKYAREYKELQMKSKEIWLSVNRPTEENESNDSKATSDQPRKKKKLETVHKYDSWKKAVCGLFNTGPPIATTGGP
jgi:hypothetical protein